MAYLFMPLSSAVLLFIDDEHKNVRFHAIQGLIVGIAMVVVNRLYNFIAIPAYSNASLGTIVGLIAVALGAGSLVLWAALIFKAYNGQKWTLPVIGGFADQQAGTGATT